MMQFFEELITWWKIKRVRDRHLQEIKAKQKAEEYRQNVEKEAYLLWEADGKQEGKDDYYWALAIYKLKGKNIPNIYKLYYLLEKRVLEPVDVWISKQAFFTILGRLGNLAIVVAIVTFIFGEDIRRNNEVFSAWQTITSANGQSGSGGRIKALQFLNSRPLRFPWIGWTKPGWYWDEREKECKLKRLWGLRWEREPLSGLSAPGAYLANIHLCEAYLEGADLQNANLWSAKLQNSYLEGAKLQNSLLWGADLQNVDLGRANLENAVLESVDLENANLWSAKLQNTFLKDTKLQNAFLKSADLENTFLWFVNLQDADLEGANLKQTFLIEVTNLTPKQIKLACFWDKAIYKGGWNWEKNSYVVKEPDNTNFIEKLKQDKLSDPKNSVDCSKWNNSQSSL